MLNYTTKIPAHKSIAEISEMLARSGAKAVMHEYDDAGNIKALNFSMMFNGREVGFRLPANWPAVQKIVNDKSKNRNWRPPMATDAHAINVTWRCIKDWVEAQLALIEANQVTTAQVFLPYAVTADGNTLYDHLANNPGLLLGRGDG